MTTKALLWIIMCCLNILSSLFQPVNHLKQNVNEIIWGDEMPSLRGGGCIKDTKWLLKNRKKHAKVQVPFLLCCRRSYRKQSLRQALLSDGFLLQSSTGRQRKGKEWEKDTETYGERWRDFFHKLVWFCSSLQKHTLTWLSRPCNYLMIRAVSKARESELSSSIHLTGLNLPSFPGDQQSLISPGLGHHLFM
jgi:hypothetical protein